jgi:hypothetical protein
MSSKKLRESTKSLLETAEVIGVKFHRDSKQELKCKITARVAQGMLIEAYATIGELNTVLEAPPEANTPKKRRDSKTSAP